MIKAIVSPFRVALTYSMILAIWSSVNLASAQTPAITPGDCWIAVTDNTSKSIMVFDPSVTDWNSSSALKHTWAPSSSNGFTTPTDGWGLPADVKIRNYNGSQYIAVADTDGFAGVIPYPSLTGKLWAVNIGSAAGVHGVELMPDGNVVVAAATPGWIRIYEASQGTYDSSYVQYDLTSAHEVLWDPANSMLWAVGYANLYGYRYSGTPASPALTLAVTSPTLPGVWGHFISPVYGNTDLLWVAADGTGGYVSQYSKSTNTFTTQGAPVNGATVRSVGSQPASGTVVETFPDSACANGWSTPTVSFYGPDYTRTRTGACFYRAVIFDPNYQ